MVNNVIGKIIQFILWTMIIIGLINLIQKRDLWGSPILSWIFWIMLFGIWIRYTVYLYRKYFYQGV